MTDNEFSSLCLWADKFEIDEYDFPRNKKTLINLDGFEPITQKITYIPKEIRLLQNLKVLSLEGNLISHIPKEIFDINGLEELYLSNNKIHYIPKEVGKLTSLTSLFLDNNCLDNKSIESFYSLLKLGKLQSLNLNFNNITCVSQEFIDIIKNNPDIYLIGNPIQNISYEVIENKIFKFDIDTIIRVFNQDKLILDNKIQKIFCPTI